MKYIVLGSAAILATRNIERLARSRIRVRVEGVPDGARLCLQSGDRVRNYAVISETATVPCEDLCEGVYYVSVHWHIEENGKKTRHEARGNPFKVYVENGGHRAVIAAPCATATEVDYMWSGLIGALESILPTLDTLKNGNDVI